MSAPIAPHPWLHLDGNAIDPDRWLASITVAKFHAETVRQVMGDCREHLQGREPVWADFVALGVQPDDWAHEEGNMLVTTGLNLLTELFEGAGGNPFNHSDAIVGIGSSTTGALVGDTHLGGDGSSSTAFYQQADSGYPTQSNGLMSCNCTIGSSNGNFSGGWQEWCLADGSGGITAGPTLSGVATGVVMINHKVVNLGTKSSGAIWTAQTSVTES